MNQATITEILDDLRAADEMTRRFERRYWLSSADFYTLYTQGVLDDGDNLEDFTLWASFFQIKQQREKDLQTLSQQRLKQLQGKPYSVKLDAPELINF